MKIDELTGYKSNPAYQTANDIFSNTYGNRYQKLSEFLRYLEENGFSILGSGVFGMVVEKPNYPWVFKIFHHDPAYLHFIKYAIANQDNPHIPKIKGGIMKIDENTYVVRMEKLGRFVWANGKQRIKFILSMLRNIDDWTMLEMLDKSKAEWIEKREPKLAKALKEISDGGFSYDLHSDNVMLRGDTLVLTDPLLHRKSFYK